MQDLSTAQRFETLFSEAVALHKAGRVAEALEQYETLLHSAPDHAQLLYLAGAAQAALARLPEAITHLERANLLRANDLPTLEMLGSVYIQAGKPTDALAPFAAAAGLSANPETQFRFANTLLLCERHADARPVFEKLTQQYPALPQAQIGLALCLAHLGMREDAETRLRNTARAHPEYAKAHTTLGTLRAQQDDFTGAEHWFRAAVALEPANAEHQKLLANSLHKQGRAAEAEVLYRSVVTTNPHDSAILCQWGEALIDLNKLDEAEEALRRSVAAAPLAAAPVTTLGRVYELRGDLGEALSLHEKSLHLNPRYENAYLNRGSAKRFLGDLEGALADYDTALDLQPDFPAARGNRALTLLALGRLGEAWADYRARLKAQAGTPDLTEDKPWDGQSLAGKNVLVWTEYGLGDEILFASLLPDLAALTASCTVVCAARLCALFRRSFPGITFLPLPGPTGGAYDVRLPLTDAAHLLRPDLASIPRHKGYLVPHPAHAATLRRSYQAENSNKIVGISWRSASGSTGAFKSTTLSDWRTILGTAGITFVSLQYGDRAQVAQDLATVATPVILDDTIDPAGDLDAFAAQVAAMDLVISVSNTTVHIAGALDIPAWVLTPRGLGAHWYWHRDSETCPWYPALRLFRQAEGGHWDAPLQAIAEQLARWAQT